MNERDIYFPLTLGQQDLFFDQLHFLGSPKYNIGGYIKLHDISISQLKRSHHQLVKAHQAFGIRLLKDEERVVQMFSEYKHTELYTVCFLGEDDPETAADAWLNTFFETPFDLFAPRLFDTVLLQIGEREYWYVGKAHHLMIDGWGFSKWIKLLGDYYNGKKASENALHEWEYLLEEDGAYYNSSRYIKDADFWTKYLSGESEPLLSPQYRRTSPYPRSQRDLLTISRSEYQQLQIQCNLLNEYPAAFFLGILSVYFHLAYKKDTLLFGVPSHNRNGARKKNIIGLFTTVSPLRLKVDPQLTFSQLLDQIQREQRRLFRHQKYPIGHMVRSIKQPVNHNLFDVGFNYLQLDAGIKYGEQSVSYVYQSHNHATIPLDLTVWDNGGSQIELQFDFNLDYFSPHEMRLLMDRVYGLLKQVVSQPDTLLADLVLLPDSEINQIEHWNQTTYEYSASLTLPQLFELQVQQVPKKIALICDDVTLSYEALNNRANQMASKLIRDGFVPGQLVAVMLPRHVDMVTVLLAVHKAGGAYVPLDPNYPESRLKYMLADSECQWLISESHLCEGFTALPHNTMLLDKFDHFSGYEADHLALNDIAAERLAYVIYTSGSTGKPKGVEIGQQALVNFLLSMREKPGISGSDTLLAVTPISFDISVLELFLPLISGGTVRLFSGSMSENVSDLFQQLEQEDITCLQMTPSGWKLLLAAGWQGKAGLKALTGGEALSATLAENLSNKVDQLWNMYGPTETTIWSSCCEVKHPLTRNTIGQPINNTQMVILDEHLKIQPIGVFGMLYIGGDGLAHGYLNRPELTQSRFIEIEGKRWYQTGDIARLTTQGDFEYQGREDHQVKLNGYRIELGEIEAILTGYCGVNFSAVAIKTLANSRQVICAYYVSEAVIGDSLLKEHLSSALPSFMLPDHFIHLSQLPLTPAGKTDLSALPIPTIQSTSVSSKLHDLTDEQRILHDIVTAQLGIAHVGLNDNFFDVGANSLDMVTLAENVSEAFHRSITVIDLFAYPSIASLMAHLSGHDAQQQENKKNIRKQSKRAGKSRLNKRLKTRKVKHEVEPTL